MKADKAKKAKDDGDGDGDGGDDEKTDRNQKSEQQPDKYKDIGAHDSCKSSLMTLSFHVKTEEVIRLYLYFNGQSMRFMPEDIKDVLPRLFNLEYADNPGWLTRKDPDGDILEVDRYINRMKRCLKDVEFEAFQQSYL